MAAQLGKGLTEAVCTTTIPPQFFEALVRDNSDMISVIDMAGRFVFISEAATRILGLKIEDWVGRDGFDLIHPDDIGVAAESLATTVASESGVREPLLLRLRHADGSWKDVEIITNNMVDDPDVGGLVIAARDMSERQRSKQTAMEARDLFEQAFDRAPIGMLIVDNDGTIRRTNRSFAEMLGVSLQELNSRNLISLAHRDDRALAIREATAIVSGEDRPAFEVRFVRSDGTDAWARVTGTLITDTTGRALHSVVQVEDVTEQQTLREELERAALHDPLTGLLNRAGLEASYDEFLAAEPGESAFFLIDLDGFKPVNDSYGHHVGDLLLKYVAKRLADTIRGEEIIARIGGDEFVAHVRGVADAREALAIAERIRSAIAEPFGIDARQVTVSGSVGVALLVGPVELEQALISSDRASYEAKRAGGNQVSLAWARAS